MNEKNEEQLLKTSKNKLEELANEFEKDPETEELSVVLFVLAGSTLLGKEAIKSLALWNATWADSVINEVGKMREEETTKDLTDKIINPNDE
jgi:hypothetical protein